MARSPDELVALFSTTMQAFPDVELRKVFGYPCGFVNGNMAVGLHADVFFVRLPASDQQTLLEKPGGGYLEPMPGRPMRDYVLVPEGMRSKKSELGRWVKRAVEHCLSLPPKVKKGRP
jgi:TfoX/Sxy family transcriptional regulator of competence genes